MVIASPQSEGDIFWNVGSRIAEVVFILVIDETRTSTRFWHRKLCKLPTSGMIECMFINTEVM